MGKNEILRELEYILFILEDLESESAPAMERIIDALYEKDFE